MHVPPKPDVLYKEYMGKDGKDNVSFTWMVPADSRVTFNMADKLKDGRAAIKVTCRTAGKKILAERSMYANNRGLGTCTIGGYSDTQ